MLENKQIIIDGVDVSGCPNFILNKIEPNESICISEQSAMCINNKDCLYKKWQRKEQECEELKIYIESNEQQVKEVETLVMDNDRLINELTQYKQALTEIKEIAEKQCVCGVDCIDMKQILQKISDLEV